MKRLNNTCVYALVVLFQFFTSCQKEELVDTAEAEAQFEQQQTNRILKNPYSVRNMKIAYENLQKNDELQSDFEITTTHLYVRFLAKDTNDVNILSKDKTLEYFDNPLDYEITEKEVPDEKSSSQKKWLYTAVPNNYEFPDVEYEILENLFLPYKNGFAKSKLEISTWDILEHEALKITDNLADDELSTKAKKWNPSGRITTEEVVYDKDLGRNRVTEIPVRRCKVRVRRWFDWASTKTDHHGNFFISEKFKKKVNYSLEFETTNFKVTNALGLSINYDGPKQKGPWNKRFSFNNQSKNWVSATFINAIADFKTQARAHGLKLPGALVNIKVRPKLEKGRSNALGIVRHFTPVVDLLKTNDVVIYTKSKKGNLLLTNHLYEVMMHELGHVTHFLKSPINIVRSLGIVNESWATAVEYYFTKPYYPKQVEGLPDQSKEEIIGGTKHSWQYTPFFIDLKDENNQLKDENSDKDKTYADDDVEKFTLKQMQKALDKEVDLPEIAKYLRKNFNNADGMKEKMQKVVDFYEDIRKNH